MSTAINAGIYLHHMQLCSQNPEALSNFYADALDMPARQKLGGAWLCEGPLRRMLFAPGENKTLGYAGFACRDAAGLAAMRERAAREDLQILDSPTPLFIPGAFGIRDPDGNLILFGLPTAEPPRPGLRGPLQHLTLASQTPEAIERFYVDRLGFRTSDYSRSPAGAMLAVWTRSNHEHHTLACFKRGRQGIDHFSFEAGDWSVIKDWCDRMGARRIPIVWGPGRHGPGNNLFIFIEDPDRNWIEISAEMEVMYGREAVTWPAEAYTLNMWGPAIFRD